MTQEALKLALEALELEEAQTHYPPQWLLRAITAIKEALAQSAEQEPVAWMDADGNVSDNNDHKCFPIPLYTTPPQRTEPLIGCVNHDCDKCKAQRTWVGLTDEEYIHITDSVYHQGHGLVAYYKAIEAKLKEINT